MVLAMTSIEDSVLGEAEVKSGQCAAPLMPILLLLRFFVGADTCADADSSDGSMIVIDDHIFRNPESFHLHRLLSTSRMITSWH